MEYEFSKNETNELNYKNYIKKMTKEIFDNEYTLNILKKCLLKISLETKQILKLIFFNGTKKKDAIFAKINNKKYSYFIEILKEEVIQYIIFYMIKIIYCLETNIIYCLETNQI